MVTRATLNTKALLAVIDKALVAYAKGLGYNPGQFQVLFWVQEEWGVITAMLVLDDYRGQPEQELRSRAREAVKKALDQHGVAGLFSPGLTIRERSQVERGGIHSIPDVYVDAADLLPASSLDD